MPNERLNLEIDVRTTGQRDVDRLTESIGRVGTTAERSAAAIISSFGKTPSVVRDLGQDIGKYSSGLLHAGEGALALAASHGTLTAAIAKYSAAGSTSITTTEGMLNAYRGIRLALSPTPFTAAVIAVGILTEETVRLVNARAKLIEQQSIISATSRISLSGIERIDAVSGISGGNAPSVRSLQSALSSRSTTDQATVNSGLNTIGVSASSPALLRDIAEGFNSIADPAKRAAAAVAIFGADNAETALRELDRSFVNASDAAAKFGLGLDTLSRNQIYGARQSWIDFKSTLSDFSEVKAAWESFKEGTEAVAGAAVDMAKRSDRAIDDMVTRYVTGFATIRAVALGNETKAPPNPGNPRKDSISQGLIADDLFAEAQSQRALYSQTLDGVKGRQTDAASRRDVAYKSLVADADKRRINPSDPGLLSGDQRFSLTVQERSAGQLAATLGQRVQKLQTEKDASDKAALTATEIARRQQESLRVSQQLVFRSSFEPGAGRNILGEIEKSTTFVDKDGGVHKYQLLDATRRNIETAFSAYTLDLNQKASREQLKSEEEGFARRKSFDASIFERRLQFIEQTGQLEIASIDRAFARESTLAGYTRDEQLKSMSIGGIGLTGSSAIRNSLAQAGQRGSIEAGYLLATSVNDTNASIRDHRRQVGDLDAKLKGGGVNQIDYEDRLKVLNSDFARQGTAINDKYSHDLLTAQQDAVASTTEIIKRLENEQMDKFKSLAGGLFDAATGGSPSNALRSFGVSLGRDLGKTITENIAETGFKSLKPLIPHVTNPDSLFGKILDKTPFGADPVKANITALDLNTAALDGLRAASISPSGGGGSVPGVSGSGAAGGIGSIFGGAAGGGIFNLFGKGATGLPGVSGSGAGGLNPSWTQLPGFDPGKSTGIGFNARTATSAIAIGGGALTAFDGFKHGGPRGAAEGVSGALGAAAGIAALIPGGQVVALGLGIAAAATGFVTALLPDPKQIREKQITKTLEQNKYYAPEALNVTQSTNGKFADFDTRGNLRQSDFSAVPNVSQPYQWWKGNTPYDAPGRINSPYGAAVPPTTIVVNLSAIDTQSGVDFIRKNPQAVGDAFADHVHSVEGRASNAVRYIASN